MTNDKLKMTNVWKLGFGICLVIVSWLLVIAPQAQAATFTATGNPDDTSAGTTIIATKENETLNYTDINGNAKPEVNPGTDINITVLPVYGFSSTDFADRTLNYGQIVTSVKGGITNEGNASDNYDLTFTCDFANKGTGDWTVNIRRAADDSLIGTLTPGGGATTTETRAIAEDADYGFYHEVTGPTTQEPGKYIVITSAATTASTPAGQYTGANGLTYGGAQSTTDNAIYMLAAPFLTLTRTSTVDAPVNAAPGPKYTGGLHDKVPGAVITYTLTYNNTGIASADSVILVDKVPGYTNMAHFNRTSSTHVPISAAQQTATGWTVWYSTQADPQKYYGNSSGWAYIGTPEAGTGFPLATSDLYNKDVFPTEFTATWVKWEKQYVASAESGTIVWGATIR